MDKKRRMQILRDGDRSDGPRIAVLGNFDGVHLGHRALIRAAREEAETRGMALQVCTFDPHPLRVVRPEKAPQLLTTPEEKAEIIAETGADELRVFHFTKETADMKPEEFLEKLRETVHPAAVWVGWNYTFGCGGAGDAELLKRTGDRFGFDARIHPPVKTDDGVTISSSGIRELLEAGDAERAARLLGDNWMMSGTVERGRGIGHTLGFPTANLHVAEEKLRPAFGVYLCTMTAEGETRNGIVNIGRHPTLPSGNVTIEVHVLTGHPDLYGKQARIRLLRRMREEKRFASAEELREQLEKDRENALRAFCMAKMV